MRQLLLLLAAWALDSEPVLADELADGIKAYNESDFGTCVKILASATKGKFGNNATAHYYLGNAYIQIKNPTAALAEYRQSLSIAPTAATAPHCLAAIQHLTPQPSKVTRVDIPTPKQNTPALPTQVGIVAEPAPIRLTGLPTIPTFPKDDGPKLSDVMTWSIGQQANYFQIAFDRKNEALLRLEKTQDVLKRAQSLASSAVPNARQFGETDSMLKTRLESGRAQMATILKPFEEAVEMRQKEAETANSLYETCVSAGRRISGY
ncbi:MAG TPA: tetratricopeptide repeat protein [Drouetiella sp.]